MRTPDAEEAATGKAPLTQFGRMCAALAPGSVVLVQEDAAGVIEIRYRRA